MKDSIMTEKYNGKYVSPQQMISLLKKNQHNRIWMLKQLSQLGIDIQLLQDCPLHQLYKHCDEIIKSTYSIKYLGMNQNEMGIISRRIDPFKDSNFCLKDLPQCPYKVNKFFYPKPLKVGKKLPKENQLNSENLQQNIKNAFLGHKSTLNPKRNRKLKPSGSWINHTTKQNMHDLTSKTSNSENVGKKQETKQLLKKNSKNQSKIYSVNIALPQTVSPWKNTTSYSGFLRSGLLFSKDIRGQSAK